VETGKRKLLGEGKMSAGFWRGNPREDKYLENLVLDRRIILKRISLLYRAILNIILNSQLIAQ